MKRQIEGPDERWPGRRMKRALAVATSVVASVAAIGGIARAAQLSAPVTYYGMCDASAAVALGTNLFAVANDEDNRLRIYRREPGAMPVTTVELSKFLAVKGKSLETDIEGGARVGNRIYWITSHGRNAKGKDSPDRHRFFATDIVGQGENVQLVPVGRPYQRLLLDFALDSRLVRYDLINASRIAPKQPGGLNIEGLTAAPDGTLLIGFRNPVRAGKTLLIPLLNPEGLIRGERISLGNPIELDLGGAGVRSMGYVDGGYVIIGGPPGTSGEFHLFRWPGPGSRATRMDDVNLAGLNPEGLAFETAGGRREFFILSDDGTVKLGGQDCKKLKDPAQRRFRGYTLGY